MSKSTEHFSQDVTIDQLIEQFVERLRAGQKPSISDYQAKYPELAEDIAELFPMLMELEDHNDSNDSVSSRLSVEIPERLGEYAIIRELGRGGMGVVYEARHETMQRRVALKVLPKALTDRQQFRERFIREARSAGQLHHTNIVPVFEVGDFDGYYFYSMQYIHGQNLDTVIHELRRFSRSERNETVLLKETKVLESDSVVSATATVSMLKGFSRKPNLAKENRADSTATQKSNQHQLDHSNIENGNPSSEWSQVGDSTTNYFHRVAHVGIQVADALEFAHEHGVLHRDIKPGNLILDTAGVVWITDFGLAKNDGDNLTHTGDVVGTLRYMAPERFDGKVDRRSDVYSLGLTLYELCTLEFAFGENDRAKLIKQVMNQSPVPPRHLRNEIPRDLETVIVKATAREAVDRYQSAADLSADLKRFLMGSPVKARRVSLSERVWRWSKRHPSRAALVVSLTLLLTTLLVGSIFVAYQKNKHSSDLEIENRRARKAEADARNAETDARKAEKQARKAERDARESEQKAHRSNRASQAHLFWAFYNSGVSRRATATPGQYYDAIDSLSQAYFTIPKLKLSSRAAERRRLAIRAQVIAAMTSVDLKKEHSWQVPDNMGYIIATDFHQNRIAQSAKNGDIEIRDIKSQKRIQLLRGVTRQAWNLLFSPDGKYLVSGHPKRSGKSDQKVVLWDVESGKPILELSENLARQTQFDFSNDGKQLVVALKNGFSVYRTNDGQVVLDENIGQSPYRIKFVKQNQQLALITDKNKVVRFWSIEQRKDAFRYESKEPLYALAWNNETNRLALGCERMVLTWPNGEFRGEPDSFIAHGTRITHVQISPDGKLLFSCGWDNMTRVFELPSNQLLLQIGAHKLSNSPVSTDSSRIAFIERDNKIGIWQIRDDSPHQMLSVAAIKQPQKVRFYPLNTDVIGVLANNEIQFWNHRTDRLIQTISCQGVSDFDFTNDGKQLFACCSQGLKTWSIELDDSKKFVADDESVLTKTSAKYLHVDQKNGVVVLRQDSGYAMIVPFDGGKEIRVGPQRQLDRAKITPCGKYVVTSTWKGRDIKVWDSKTGENLKSLAPEWATATLDMSPDGKFLVANSADEQRVWEIGSWELKRQTPRDKPDGMIGGTDWSSDGKLIASAYTTHQPQLTLAETGAIVAVLDPKTPLAAHMLKFSQDNQYLAVASRDQVHVWNIQSIQEELKKLGMNW